MKRSIEYQLLKWKKSRLRYPLILRGARQVGKTYIVEKFGKEAFPSFVSVNFEAQPEAMACFDTLDPDEILTKLQSILKVKIIPGETLLFLDEIQMCPQAIVALRYFKERCETLHVIGAGSLLEFALIQGKFSFPVGRVQFLYLTPFSFDEYLEARNTPHTLWSLDKTPSSEEHQKLLKLVREYFLVGGMPAAVSAFSESLSLEEVKSIHEILLSTYQADFSKYASPAQQKYLKIFFQGSFPLIAEQFKYSKVDLHIRSRELKDALDHLEWAGLFKKVQASSASGVPLSAQLKKNRFKLLFVDIGLVQHALKLDIGAVYNKPLIQINRGAIAEQFVGQELLAYRDPKTEESLFYWEREKIGSAAEIDFLVSYKSHIIPIEVKAGPTGRLRSIHQFMKDKKCSIGIHISEKPLSYEKGILTVPFYLISQIPTLLQELL